MLSCCEGISLTVKHIFSGSNPLLFYLHFLHRQSRLDSKMDAKSIIEGYFRKGFTNTEILLLLQESHNIRMSLRSLERTLSKNHLWRRKNKTDDLEVACFLQQQLQTSGRQHGYRWMHQKCWMAGIITDRETVRLLLTLMDSDGVSLRASNRLRRRVYCSRGPNYIWHIDGYDKLKPYGICISGCIDGFSRKMIWLEAYKTNSNPRIIARYFIDAINKINGCPQRLRLDNGTENTHVVQMQKCLRHSSNESGTDCVTLGPSTGNQRIERWWATLRSECVQFWMDHFDQLEADGHFADSFLDKSLIQFCFQNVIQGELNETVTAWNDHRIRPSHNPRSPNGRPTVMYAVPDLYDAQEFLQPVNQREVEICQEECTAKDYPCDEDVFHICTDLMAEHGLDMSDDIYQITDLYISLRQLILDVFNTDN